MTICSAPHVASLNMQMSCQYILCYLMVYPKISCILYIVHGNGCLLETQQLVAKMSFDTYLGHCLQPINICLHCSKSQKLHRNNQIFYRIPIIS